MRLKKVFAVFFTFCLIFSASLLPVSAELYYPPDYEKVLENCVNYLPDLNIPNGVVDVSSGYMGGFVYAFAGTGPMDQFGYLDPGIAPTYLCPIVGSKFAYSTAYSGSGESVTVYPSLAFYSSEALNTPYRWYFGIGCVNNTPVTTNGTGSNWGAGTWNIYPSYDASSRNGVKVESLIQMPPTSIVVDSSNVSYGHVSYINEMKVDIVPTHESNAIRQVDVWAYDLSYTYTLGSDTVNGLYIPWSFCIPLTAYTDVIENVYLELVKVNTSLSGNFPLIHSSLSAIVSQLEALNTDTDTIIEVLNAIKNLDQQQLSVLNYILTTTQSLDTTVKQIYALMLSEVSGTDELSDSASSAADSINDNDVQEVHWQTNMSYNFDQLQLGNYNLNLLGGGLALVGNMFSSIWSAFGQWSIVFTFPLILGIALLVIGRLSKTGGGNSSRNSEHKGGEGGA